jgi:hypothetical protein
MQEKFKNMRTTSKNDAAEECKKVQRMQKIWKKNTKKILKKYYIWELRLQTHVVSEYKRCRRMQEIIKIWDLRLKRMQKNAKSFKECKKHEK